MNDDTRESEETDVKPYEGKDENVPRAQEDGHQDDEFDPEYTSEPDSVPVRPTEGEPVGGQELAPVAPKEDS